MVERRASRAASREPARTIALECARRDRESRNNHFEGQLLREQGGITDAKVEGGIDQTLACQRGER
jgi:hypothetical protein